MRMWGLSLAAIAMVVVAACGGAASTDSTNTGTAPTTPTTPANPNTVSLVDSSFSPASLTIKSGQTVTWQWSACSDTTGSGGYGYGSGSCISHQISFDDGSGVVSPLQDAGSFNRTFTTTGTFKYHCLVHGSYMSGQITVQ